MLFSGELLTGPLGWWNEGNICCPYRSYNYYHSRGLVSSCVTFFVYSNDNKKIRDVVSQLTNMLDKNASIAPFDSVFKSVFIVDRNLRLLSLTKDSNHILH